MNVTVEITGVAYGGSGVGRTDGKVVFVPFTAPGDVAEVEITKDKKSFFEGRLVRIATPGPDRVEPECPYFGRCGGCQLQHIGYGAQVELKQEMLAETLKRIGRAEPERFDPPVPSPLPYAYRSRARFHVDTDGGSVKMGFFEASTNRVVDIERCPILTDDLNGAYSALRRALTGAPSLPVDAGLHTVELASDPSGTAAAFHAASGALEGWEALMEGVPGLKGVEVWSDPGRSQRGRFVKSYGDTAVSYTVGEMEMTASVSVFTQANTALNPALVARAVELAGLKGTERVVDLFCGVGNLTLPAALNAAGAEGVETNPKAVRLARENAARAGMKKVRFRRERAMDWFRRGSKTLDKGQEDVIILDPPRGGDKEVARAVSGLDRVRIVYVSCSPPTLARDISLLSGRGYRPTRAVLVDMFPQTYHIECVVALSR